MQQNISTHSTIRKHMCNESYLLVTSAWYVIYIIQWSTLGLCTFTEMYCVIFNLHILIRISQHCIRLSLN